MEEGTGFVEFCINLFEPDPALIDPLVAVSFFVETIDGMAIGMDNACSTAIHTVFSFCVNSLPVLTYTANIWHTLEVDKNIITRKFLTQKFANEINANYGNIIIAALK